MLQRIFITGFMTSGKSTIGPILANVIGWDFYDLDRLIERNEKRSITEIFENEGEEYFRRIETDALKELCRKSNVIVSLGGGTIALEENLTMMKETGKIIYLKVSPETIYNRIKNKIDRPLFRSLVLSETSEHEMVAKIMELMELRSKYYKCADFEFSTEDKSIGLTVDKIAKKIRPLLYE